MYLAHIRCKTITDWLIENYLDYLNKSQASDPERGLEEPEFLQRRSSMFLWVPEGREGPCFINHSSFSAYHHTQNILNKNLIKAWICKWQPRLFYPLEEYLPDNAYLPACLFPLSISYLRISHCFVVPNCPDFTTSSEKPHPEGEET